MSFDRFRELAERAEAAGQRLVALNLLGACLVLAPVEKIGLKRVAEVRRAIRRLQTV
jgi:hypothetical protein